MADPKPGKIMVAFQEYVCKADIPEFFARYDLDPVVHHKKIDLYCVEVRAGKEDETIRLLRMNPKIEVAVRRWSEAVNHGRYQ